MSRSIIVFGGSGFIGTHMIRRLVSEGKTAIISLDLKPQRETLPGVEYHIGDVRDLSQFDVPSEIERIYNFAAVHTTPGHQVHEYYETNILGALEVTRFAARHNVPEIIFTSSISVYGPSEEIKTEDSLLTPNSAYGYSKMLAERVHRHWYDDQNGRRLTIVRPAVVFGPGERGNFTRLAKLLQKGLFVYPGRKDTIKACIYVDDLIDCIEVGRNHESTFVLFNAAYPQRYTLEQIVETFIQKHFPKAKTALLPHQFVSCAASLLKVANLFDIGFSPERVTKLVHSTNISPGWLISQKQSFPNALEKALQKWGDESQGKFF